MLGGGLGPPSPMCVLSWGVSTQASARVVTFATHHKMSSVRCVKVATHHKMSSAFLSEYFEYSLLGLLE